MRSNTVIRGRDKDRSLLNVNTLLYQNNVERTISQNLHNYLMGDGETPYLRSIDEEPKDSILNSIFNRLNSVEDEESSPLASLLQLDKNKTTQTHTKLQTQNSNSNSLAITIKSMKMFNSTRNIKMNGSKKSISSSNRNNKLMMKLKGAI